MIDYDGGYIKLHRKTLKSQVFSSDAVLFRVWMWCLLRASYKKRWVQIDTGSGVTEIEILPGQFLYGRRKSAKELKITESLLRYKIEKLKKIGNIVVKTTNKFSIISVINWDTYQQVDFEINPATTQQPPSNHPATTQQQPSNHPATATNNKVKKEKNLKESKEGKELKEKEIHPGEPGLDFSSQDSSPKISSAEKNKTELKKYLKAKIIERGLTNFESKILEFFEYRMTQKIKGKFRKYNSEKSIDLLLKHVSGCEEKMLNVSDCIDDAIGQEWVTPNPDYFKQTDFKSGAINSKRYSEPEQTTRNKQAVIDFINDMKKGGT